MIHPSTQALLDFFESEHLAPRQQAIVIPIAALAYALVDELGDTAYGAELTTGLRKLLEAKDCFVRASLTKAAGAR